MIQVNEVDNSVEVTVSLSPQVFIDLTVPDDDVAPLNGSPDHDDDVIEIMDTDTSEGTTSEASGNDGPRYIISIDVGTV
jgi:hypothetical protein